MVCSSLASRFYRSRTIPRDLVYRKQQGGSWEDFYNEVSVNWKKPGVTIS